MIKSYASKAALAAAGLPSSESRVALVSDTNDVVVDGVNVIKSIPRFADPVYEDSEGKLYFIDQDSYNRALIPSDWTYKGPFLKEWDADNWEVFNGNFTSLPSFKYADVVQFLVAVPSTSGMLNLGAQFTTGVTTTISVEYTEGMELAAVQETYEENDDTLCGRINAAIAALEEITGTWWAYLNGNGEVILQRDSWTEYRQYICSGALTHVTWEDMPSTNVYFKANGQQTNYRGIMNFAGGAAYWSTNGRDLTKDVAVGSEAGNTNPMKLSEYRSSEFAAAIRDAYPTYEDYLRGEFGIPLRQKLGVFALPDAKHLTDKYGPATAPTKDGGVKVKFPALNWAYNLGGGNFLWGVEEGVQILEDSNLAALNATQRKAGKVQLSNAAYRWFAQRYSANSAWIFYGTSRNLGGYYVYGTLQVGAVTLLRKR